MQRRWVFPIFVIGLMIITIFMVWLTPVVASGLSSGQMQIPTVAVPTVTGTIAGPMAVVKSGPEPQINLRSGPSSLYERVGVLLVRRMIPAEVLADCRARAQAAAGEPKPRNWIAGAMIVRRVLHALYDLGLLPRVGIATPAEISRAR